MDEACRRRRSMVGWYDPRVLVALGLSGRDRQHLRPPLGYAAHRSARQPAAERVRLLASRRRFLARLRRRHRRRLELDVTPSPTPSRSPTLDCSSTAVRAITTQRRPGAGVRRRRGLSISRRARNTRCAPKRRTAWRSRAARAPTCSRFPATTTGTTAWSRSRAPSAGRSAASPDCTTRQTRSYFALKLPANWWLLAIDLQLGADLDEPQVQYFQKVRGAHGRCRAPDLLRAGAALDPRRRLSRGTRTTKSSRARAFSRRRCSGARRACSSPATCISTSAMKTPKASRRSPRAAAARSCTRPTRPRRKELRNGFVQRAAYPDEKTSATPVVAKFPVPVHQSEVRLVVRVPLRDVGVAGLGEPRSSGRHRSADRARRGDERGDPRSAQRHVAGHDHRRIHLLHRHAHALVAHPGRRIPRAAAPGGGVHGGLVRVAAHGERLRSRATAASRSCCSRALITFMLGGPVGAFILGVYLFVSIRVFGRHGERGVLVAAHRGFQAVAAAADRCGGESHDLRDRASTACRAAGVPRSARASRRWWRMTRAPRAPRLIDKVEVRA